MGDLLLSDTLHNIQTWQTLCTHRPRNGISQGDGMVIDHKWLKFKSDLVFHSAYDGINCYLCNREFDLKRLGLASKKSSYF